MYQVIIAICLLNENESYIGPVTSAELQMAPYYTKTLLHGSIKDII